MRAERAVKSVEPSDQKVDAVGEPDEEEVEVDVELDTRPGPVGRGRAEGDKLDQFLLRRYHLYGDRAARDELITMYLPLVRSLARRYAARGEHFDDLVQVGSIGLIKAIDRFDLSRGVELTTYATPNIVGEIKRYFRDKGWSVRVPRGLQELNIRLNKVIDELVPRLQRSPTINEIAEAAGATPEEVLEALETSQAYNSVSLQASPNGEGGDDETGLIDYLPSDRRRLRDDRGPDHAGSPASRSSTIASATSCTCASSRGSPSRRSPAASASRRCTSRGSSAAPSRSCARTSARAFSRAPPPVLP